jgi:exopolysaccharide biosynthesis polyprenyl glycosylphosphotransferase
MGLVWLLFFKIAGLYNPYQIRRYINQIVKIFLACTAGMSAVVIFLFFKREFLFSSRFIILAAWALSIILVILARGIIRILRRLLFRYGIAVKSVIIVGGDEQTNHFVQRLKDEHAWGYHIIDRVLTLDQLKNKLTKEKVGEVILADVNYGREKMQELLEFCQIKHLDFRYAADVFSARLHNVEVDDILGFPFIEIKRTPLEGWGKIKKRIIDVVLGILAILFFLPLSVVIVLMVKLTSHGPIFVKLNRIGEGGRLFKIYKFRSMFKDAHFLKQRFVSQNERKGPLFKMKDDPRITKFGRFLRRFSLDELPNLYNVLMGQMSLVGPRPHEPEEVAKYKEYQKKLLNIKPGITGIAQISGRSNLDFDEEARLDLYYIENWNLKTDFSILLKTPFAVFLRREGAV